jgi:hypothetical protein
MGGLSKAPVLEAFKRHIFFDDQDVHCAPASVVVPTARVMIRDMKGEQVPLDFEVPVPVATYSIPKKEPSSVTAVIVPLPAEISHAKK